MTLHEVTDTVRPVWASSSSPIRSAVAPLTLNGSACGGI
uniref:Uncharacterized protein n=1 Tax=uncultured Nocardioidaceae bacterium TaxID=253824 RepID=A0A6J4LMP4_9ACTN|nr:MAG: hypothetical protein AVDCRST_MAG46-1747 [uncultured Nocardioidaceae bacterium]